MGNVTVQDVCKAAEDEAAGKPVADPRLREFIRTATAARSNAVGSDSDRHSHRQNVWGICTVYSKPHVWLTTNPVDHHDPIAMLVGEDIDLDDFVQSAGPGASERNARLVEDPFAAAEYFHIVIKAVLEHLIGVTANNSSVNSEPGVLGLVSAYYAMVEAQGRATLHLHCLLWLANSPDCHELARLFTDVNFLQHVNEYGRQCIKADVEGLSQERGLAPAPSPHPSWSRPPDPDAADWHSIAEQVERNHVESSQFHKCTPHPFGCAPPPDSSRKKCKRSFPFACSDDARIDSKGECVVCPLLMVLPGCKLTLESL